MRSVGSREDDEYWNERYEHLRDCDECGEALDYERFSGMCYDCEEAEDE